MYPLLLLTLGLAAWACASDAEPLVPEDGACIDNDDGDPYEKGTRNTYTATPGTLEAKDHWIDADQCVDGNTLQEFTCDRNKYRHGIPVTRIFRCESGCSSGACKEGDVTLTSETEETEKGIGW